MYILQWTAHWQHSNTTTNMYRPTIMHHYLSHSYSIEHGTDTKIGLRLTVCLSVCPCLITLTVAFLCRFSPNLTQWCKRPKVRTSSLGVNIAPPLPLFYPQNCHFWSRGPENQRKYEKCNICLKCSRIAKIPAFIGNRGRGTRRWCQIFYRK